MTNDEHATTTTATPGDRPVIVISDAAGYVGPSLARLLAATHDLVLGDPAEGLVASLEEAGAAVVATDGVRDLSRPAATDELVARALERFGGSMRPWRSRAASSSAGSCGRRSTISARPSSGAWKRPTCSCAAWCRR
jgi:hypothetical protein